MKKNKILFGLCVVSVFAACNADAAINVNSKGANDSSAAIAIEEDYDLQGMSEMEAIATLKKDLVELDRKIEECEKKRKGWIAATVIGGAGVVGTGVAAIVQGKKVSDSKAELEDVKQQLSDTKGQVTDAQNRLNEANKSQGK